MAAAWTAAQSKAAARQPRSDSTAYIDTPAPAFKSAAPTPQARLLASSRCLLVAAAPTAARRRLHRTAAPTAAPTRPPMCRRMAPTAASTDAAHSCSHGCSACTGTINMQRIEVRSRRKHRIHPIKLTFSNPKALAADQNQISGQGSAKTATSDHQAATNVRSNLTYLVGNRSNLVQPPDNTVHRPGHDRWLRTLRTRLSAHAR